MKYVAIIAATTLAGCTPVYHHVDRHGAPDTTQTEQDFYETQSECQSRSNGSRIVTLMDAAVSLRIFKTCMRGKGWIST